MTGVCCGRKPSRFWGLRSFSENMMAPKTFWIRRFWPAMQEKNTLNKIKQMHTSKNEIVLLFNGLAAAALTTVLDSAVKEINFKGAIGWILTMQMDTLFENPRNPDTTPGFIWLSFWLSRIMLLSGPIPERWGLGSSCTLLHIVTPVSHFLGYPLTSSAPKESSTSKSWQRSAIVPCPSWSFWASLLIIT